MFRLSHWFNKLFQFNRRHWLNKSVQFNREVADQTLLDMIQGELLKHPKKTFSDLCKEALWQYLCVPKSVQPQYSSGKTEEQIIQLQTQLADFEQRLSVNQFNHWEVIESKLNQLSNLGTSSQLERLEQQLNYMSMQLEEMSMSAHQQPLNTPIYSQPQPYIEAELPPQEVEELDPALSRLSSLLEDF